MRLVIEDIQIPGPDGHLSISVAHYAGHAGQNSHAMCALELVSELVERRDSVELVPYYYRNDCTGVEQ